MVQDSRVRSEVQDSRMSTLEPSKESCLGATPRLSSLDRTCILSNPFQGFECSRVLLSRVLQVPLAWRWTQPGSPSWSHRSTSPSSHTSKTVRTKSCAKLHTRCTTPTHTEGHRSSAPPPKDPTHSYKPCSNETQTSTKPHTMERRPYTGPCSRINLPPYKRSSDQAQTRSCETNPAT